MRRKIGTIIAIFALVTLTVPLFGCNRFDNTSFKIGATGPLTGDAASYGISVQKGANLAIKHINESGNMRFSLDMKDDRSDPWQAAQNYDRLYDRGMQLSLGGVTSGAGEAFAKKANSDGIFTLTPCASADAVITDMPYSFRICYGDLDQGVFAADEIARIGYVKIGALYDSSDPYSYGIYRAFNARMSELGLNYIEASFDAENKTDFSTQAEALKECDVVFMPFYYTEAQLFIKKSVEKGSVATFFGSDGFDGIASYVVGVKCRIMYITPFDVNSPDEATERFVDAYFREYGVLPDQFAADAYDAVMVIATAIDTAYIDSYDISAAALGQILFETLTSEDFHYSGLTGDMRWNESGACIKMPEIVVLDIKKP